MSFKIDHAFFVRKKSCMDNHGQQVFRMITILYRFMLTSVRSNAEIGTYNIYFIIYLHVFTYHGNLWQSTLYEPE